LTIWKKALSVGTSAALLASLLITAVAPAALATTTVTSAGAVAIGQTTTTTASFLFTENDIKDLTAAGNFDVYIFDNGGDCAVAPGVGVNTNATVHFVGPATISAPGSLGATVTLSDHSFNVKWTAKDDANVETILIGGLKIKADATPVAAKTGAIKACVYNDTGMFAAAFADTTVTASGKLAQAYGVNTTLWQVAVDATSACDFFGPKNITVGGEVRTPSNIDLKVVTTGQQAITTNAFAVNHLANEVVSQTVPNCKLTTLGSPGSVADSLKYNAPDGQTRLNPGETNQGPVFNLSAQERTVGFLAKDSTLTLTIATAGVTFSRAPQASVSDAGVAATTTLLTLTGATTGTNVYGILAADAKSVSWKVATKSGTADATTGTILTGDTALITFGHYTETTGSIFYDVASTVATGTSVDVTLAASAGAVQPTSRSNAVIGRVLNVSSTSPVVYIGENNQTAGQVTVTEVGPGFFQAGTGSMNTLAICIIANNLTRQNEQFSAAPWAKVTAGDLKLREGDVVSPDNVVLGKPIAVAGIPFSCYYWTVWSASATASTVVLSSDEAGTTGLKINVPAGTSPGPVTASIRTGDVNAIGGLLSDANTILEARVQIAVRQFRNQVAVTALSQPVIPVGSNGSKVGDIQIQETANGQLKTDEAICVDIVPNQNFNDLYDAFLIGANTADRPIVTASNGILAGFVTMNTKRCDGSDKIMAGTLVESFSFAITQQSNSGNGKLVISNIKYATVNDAVEGPVMVNVYGYSGSNTKLEFQALISNARIGAKSAIKISAVSALGVPPNQGPASTSTKVAQPNKFITWRFSGGAALAGKTVRIYVSTRNAAGGYGPFVNLTGRVADAAGMAFFSWRATNTWVSVRAYFAGDATYLASWSAPTQGRWL